jgi:hypothetical protein
VVVQRLEAKSGTIVVSRDAGTKIEFEAEGNVPGGAAALGSLSAGASLAYADAMSQLLVGKAGLTPLFHTLRLDRGFWSGTLKPIFYRADEGGPPPPAADVQQIPEDAAFGTVDYDEET